MKILIFFNSFLHKIKYFLTTKLFCIHYSHTKILLFGQITQKIYKSEFKVIIKNVSICNQFLLIAQKCIKYNDNLL